MTTEKKLAKPGLWIIEKVVINNENLTNFLLSNTISFHNPGEVGLPFFKTKETDKGVWTYFKSEEQEYISIDAPNSVFNGKYLVNLKERSDGKEVILELKSENVFISASTLSAMMR